MYAYVMSNQAEGASPQGQAPTATQAPANNDIPRTILRALSKPFGPSQVRWRLGSGAKVREGQPPPTEAKVLAYIDARDCHNRLDAVLGLDWECSYQELRQGKIIVCAITITVGGRKITRSNGADDTDVEPNMGAMSVAFRRAATMFGIGRDLYGYPSPKVKVRAFGKALYMEDSEKPKLQAIVKERLEAWEKAEAARIEKAKAKRATQGQAPQPAPVAAPAKSAPVEQKPAEATPVQAEAAPVVNDEEQAQERTVLYQSWMERISAAGEAKDKEKLQVIAKEIGAGPFAAKTQERVALLSSWTKAMRLIDPNYGKKQTAQA